jgi:uncharacterized membrane protein YwzB
MSVKFFLYLIVVPTITWSLDAINLNFLFKKNKIREARIIYIILTLALSYLVVNFIYDFFEVSKIY